MPFFGGENRVFLLQTKKGNEPQEKRKPKENKQKKQIRRV